MKIAIKVWSKWILFSIYANCTNCMCFLCESLENQLIFKRTEAMSCSHMGGGFSATASDANNCVINKGHAQSVAKSVASKQKDKVPGQVSINNQSGSVLNETENVNQSDE